MHLTNEQISKTYSIIESALNYLFKDYKNSSLVQKNDLSDILQNTMLRILKQIENFDDIKLHLFLDKCQKDLIAIDKLVEKPYF